MEIKLKNRLLVRFILSALIAFFLYTPSVQATSAQDIWWDPSESGWGMNVMEQGSTLGFAIYVYDQNQNPTWYLGAGSSSGSGSFVWTRQMYSYRGPYFGGVFASNVVGTTPVGTFSFTLNNVQTATLTYTVNGASVTKSLSRLSIGYNDLTGNYIGGLGGQDSNCTNVAFNGSVINAGTIQVTQLGSSVSLVTSTNGVSCTYSGTYSQTGRYGNIVGSYSCTSGESGIFNAFEIDSNSQGFTGRYVSNVSMSGVSCQRQGRIGGISSILSGF